MRAPIRSSPYSGEIFRVLGGNPILGILAGTVITAIIQSSTALSPYFSPRHGRHGDQGSSSLYHPWTEHRYLCDCPSSSAGTNTTAKRAANIHILFNVIGAVIFGMVMFIVQLFVPDFANSPMTVVDISLFHTVYNILLHHHHVSHGQRAGKAFRNDDKGIRRFQGAGCKIARARPRRCRRDWISVYLALRLP